ncbi:MAG: Trk system potassium transporter TrkA, partial [Clostridiales bacterium]|nr:Trk system potassium transporter TrkA [Clostridiales bacterium]
MNLRIKRPAHHLRIIIVGCGKVGHTLVERLTKEGHDIVLIDQDAQVIAETSNQFDIMSVVGNGASYQVQQEAGIDEADLIIAVTKSDELNLLCCIIAAQIGRCAAIARVRTPDYSKELGYLRDKLGLAVIINPEMEAARQIAQLLYLPSALEINTFAHGQTQMVKFKIPEGNILDNITIAYLGMNITNDILICAVERNGEIYIPDGNFRLLAGDTISFIAGYQTSRSFLNKIGFSTRQVSDTLIIGGGKSAYYLSMSLIAAGIKVKIIEKDFARCEELSALLPDATIICGDGSDQELLDEEGLKSVDSFVALTGMDEENIMLSLYAKHVSDAKVVTKINRITFTNVINQLDLGSVIYPRYIT